MKYSQHEVESIRSALNDRAELVADSLLGEPSQLSARERRWGKHGSKALCCNGSERGLWYDHEAGIGGDLIDLIRTARNVSFSEALRIASTELLQTPETSTFEFSVEPIGSQQSDSRRRIEFALRIWNDSRSIFGTLAERYLCAHRKLPLSNIRLDHCLRWHSDTSALIGLMTDPTTAKPCGIHRTFLNKDGSKQERKMLGRQGVIRLCADASVTTGLGITEGVEDGLAILLAGWSPIWTATSAGAIAAFPIIPAIESLTIFPDADDAGRKAAETCRTRWERQGREVRIAIPGARE